jgi:glycosyltransferase involved in cell wall biosynthesis
MSSKFSVVIVCKNEAAIIHRALAAISSLTDDIIVYDNGSTDGTIEIIKQNNVRLEQGQWFGYGRTKHIAVNLAKYDWVLNLDADEIPDEKLQQELKVLSLTPGTVYKIRFRNFLGDKYLKWGEWGGDKHVRLFNRKQVNWNEADIHEQLNIPAGTKTKMIKGYILHYTTRDIVEYSNKMVNYALLNAEKYYTNGKKGSLLKLYVNPAFAFVKYYLFQLGLLDGWEGLVTARMTSFYTFLKYSRLYELTRRKREER